MKKATGEDTLSAILHTYYNKSICTLQIFGAVIVNKLVTERDIAEDSLLDNNL